MEESKDMDELSKLKSLLAEKESALLQAARYGQGLLEANSHLEEALQEAHGEYEQKWEEMEQVKHSLELKLEVCRKSEERLESGILEEKLSSKAQLTQKLEVLAREHSKEVNSLKQKVQEIRNELDEKNLLIDQQTKKLASLSRKLSEFENCAVQTKVNTSLTPELTELTSENQMLFTEVERLNEEICEMNNLVQSLNLQVSSLKEKNATLRSEQQQTEIENASYYNALEQSRQEIRELQGEMELIRLEALDPSRKGNSLFGEVEDRRVQAEKNLISAQVKLKSTERKYRQQANYNVQLKTQIVQLLQSGCRDADRDHIHRLEGLLSESQSDVRRFVEKVADLEKKLSQQHTTQVSLIRTNSDTSDNVADLLEMLLKKKDSELTKLNKETQECRLNLMAEARKVNELERDAYAAKRDRDKALSQVAKLNLEVTRLKLKCGEEVEGKRAIRFTKVEKIEDTPSIESSTKVDGKENNSSSSEKFKEITSTPETNKVNFAKETVTLSNAISPLATANRMHHVNQQCPDQCKHQ